METGMTAREEAWEHGLPSCLQHDLDAYKEGREKGSSLLDCLWCELYGSINGAETPYLTDLQRKFPLVYLNARRERIFAS